MLIASTSYLNHTPDTKTILLNQTTLLCVSVPILLQLPILVSATFLLFTFGRVMLLKWGIQKLPVWGVALMLAIVAALVFLQLGTFIGLQGGMSFLLLLGALKSFEGHSRRDWQVSALVQVFLLAGAVLFDQSLWVGIWVMFCLMMIASTLAILNELSWQSALRQSATAFVLALPLMLLLFVAIPRRDAPLWGLPQQTTQSTTGLSETMKAGSIGDLVQSNEPAFTATFADGFTPKQNQLYWRVMLMSERDANGEWRMERHRMDNARPPSPSDAHSVQYQIVLEDIKGKIPVLDYPQERQRRGIMRESGNVLRVYSRQGVRGIQLSSSLGDTLNHQLTAPEVNFYTKLPENTNPRTRTLAQQLAQQSNGDVEQFVRLAYQYFQKQGFSYTLQPPVLNSINSTDEFIFTSKQGFCEHYADAFVVLMRSAGVPARVVTGYQGGEWDEQGGFWQIRSKDAHAWTEVWLPEKNAWQRIDPTAAVSATRIDAGLDNALSAAELSVLRNMGSLSRLADNMQIYWQRWVVNFDGAQQQNLFSLLGLGKVDARSVALLLLLGAMPALLPLWWWWRRSRQRDIDPMQNGFMLLKRYLLGKQFAHLPAISVLELQNILANEQRLHDDIKQVLDDFMHLNYAQATTPSAAIAKKWYKQARKVAHKYRLKDPS